MSRKTPPPEPDMLTPSAIGQTLDHLDHRQLNDEDYTTAAATCRLALWLADELERKKLTIKRLEKIIWTSSERSASIMPDHQNTDQTDSDHTEQPDSEQGETATSPASGRTRKKPIKGHGRLPASAYWGADQITVPLTGYRPGDQCPFCEKGRVYPFSNPGVIITLRGQAPITGTVYHLERFRCSSCGELITADAPPQAAMKYDHSASATVALLKYGVGMPFYRLGQLQAHNGVPLPPSNQWQMVGDLAQVVTPVVHRLWYDAAQAFLFHLDDTRSHIRSFVTVPDTETPTALVENKRKGTYTTGIVACHQDHTVVLYQTGRSHAGDTLGALLDEREQHSDKPLLMCDALAANVPVDHEVELCHCNAHGRRQFVELLPSFPEACQRVISDLRLVYRNESVTQDHHMSAEQRLAYHQQHSTPIMAKLEGWLHTQLDDHLVEPNSALGDAITYMIKHWETLTKFLHLPGAPLDNNAAERILKMVVLHRKNAYFFKSDRGAWVADVLMSLIATCIQAKVNPMHYLIILQKNAARVRHGPDKWLPWNYQATLNARHSRSGRVFTP
ncbi:IS66 family transposase [bacterium]|nr:IS66 family transposase [bacterium]